MKKKMRETKMKSFNMFVVVETWGQSCVSPVMTDEKDAIALKKGWFKSRGYRVAQVRVSEIPRKKK